jgi:hypothetical protein
MMPRTWMSCGISRVTGELGALGIAALVIAAAAAGLDWYGLQPLQARGQQVERELARQLAHERADDARLLRDAGPAAKLAAFYGYFETGEAPAQWLARLNAIARSSGIEMRSAEYRMHRTGSRIERYEIALPLNGGYAQIRSFMDKALAEIPVLSLDQVSFKRNHGSERTVQADLRLTLHVVAGTAR